MSVSRRAFVRTLTVRAPSAAALAARGREAWIGEYGPAGPQDAAPRERVRDAVRLNSNENPLGPSPVAIRAIENAFAYSGRYPMNAKPAMTDFRALVAGKNNLKPENVTLGAGSGEILDSAVRAFTSPRAGLVAGLPTFELPARIARELDVPIHDVPVDRAGRLDLERMITASTGAGLVFVCNPNNPTGTVHPAGAIADLVVRIRKASPDTVILIDEAYHEYVTDAAYATAIPLVADHPHVMISRTMSKAHGMAGLRLGYAVGQPDIVSRLARWTMPYNANALAVGAAVASIEDEDGIARERRRNAEALKFTTDFFRSAGMTMTDSHTNFIWVDLGRSATDFREACARQGMLVGRPFPPLEKTHCRVSIGTMEEMERAARVFTAVLGLTTMSAGRER